METAIKGILRIWDRNGFQVTAIINLRYIMKGEATRNNIPTKFRNIAEYCPESPCARAGFQ